MHCLARLPSLPCRNHNIMISLLQKTSATLITLGQIPGCKRHAAAAVLLDRQSCCIDRWDNNERSRAINSMFQWYWNAARCYVFLSDVSLSVAKETGIAPCSDWEASFRASAWFTQGRTLQELIAPVTVEFFSREGQHIGDKASLNRLPHNVTSTPLTALRNNPLDQFSTTEQRRWVNNCKTTEKEDIVYCLLRVLGISMLIIYSEGEENVQRRLQAEIEAAGSALLIILFL